MDPSPQGQVRGRKLGSALTLKEIDGRHLDGVLAIARDAFPKPWGRQDFAYFLTHERRVCLGWLDTQGVLLAYFLGLLVQGDLDVIQLATCPPYRGLGLARALLERAMRGRLVRRAFLEVSVENTPALKLYEKVGFQRLSVRRGYYGGTQDAFHMVCIPSSLEGEPPFSR